MLKSMWAREIPHSLLVDMKIGFVTTESSVEKS